MIGDVARQGRRDDRRHHRHRRARCCAGAEALREAGATRVIACATHALFNEPALERIAESALRARVVTDTVPVDPLTQAGQRRGALDLGPARRDDPERLRGRLGLGDLRRREPALLSGPASLNSRGSRNRLGSGRRLEGKRGDEEGNRWAGDARAVAVRRRPSRSPEARYTESTARMTRPHPCQHAGRRRPRSANSHELRPAMYDTVERGRERSSPVTQARSVAPFVDPDGSRRPAAAASSLRSHGADGFSGVCLPTGSGRHLRVGRRPLAARLDARGRATTRSAKARAAWSPVVDLLFRPRAACKATASSCRRCRRTRSSPARDCRRTVLRPLAPMKMAAAPKMSKTAPAL